MDAFMRSIAPLVDGGERGEPGTPLRFVLTTEGKKDDGLDIKFDSWDMSAFSRNPIVTSHHIIMDMLRGTDAPPPIGRANVFPDALNRRWLADVTFDMADPMGATFDAKYRSGFMHAVSAEWVGAGRRGRKKNELYAIACAVIPADSEAVLIGHARDLLAGAGLLPGLLQVAGADDWERTAADMVRLFRPDTAIPENERHARYNRLARQYRSFGREAPEFRELSEIAALGPVEFRGLFVAGEPDDVPDAFEVEARAGRAGRIIAGRNLDKLRQAVTLLSEIVAEQDQADALAAAGSPDPLADAKALLEVLK